ASHLAMDRRDTSKSHQNVEVPVIRYFHPGKRVNKPVDDHWPRKTSKSSTSTEIPDQPDHETEVGEREQKLVRQRGDPDQRSQHVEQRTISIVRNNATPRILAVKNVLPFCKVRFIISPDPE